MNILNVELNQEQILRKVAESLYNFLTTPDEVEKYAKMIQLNFSTNCVHRYNIEIFNLFDPELQLVNTKTMIKNKLIELFSELKKLEYKNRNDREIFHSSAKLIASDSDIDEAFKSMHPSKHHDISKKILRVKIGLFKQF